MNRPVLFLLFCFSVQLNCLAQGSVRGRISDGTEPLSFVHIGISGQKTGVFSDDQGYFFLDKVPAGTLTLHCSYVGYQSKEIPVMVRSGEESFVSISMDRSFPNSMR
ncbi:MAG: carboxypeptidase-like regulatory domain-containing protein [Cyclobacteriaceae bacterium]|nr:carboxypeptidase-like regulatory domain-containing protein [Cyclobacteriaceae bacterium]